MNQKKIGILGGGQLGRMFIQNALNYPVDIHILDPNPNAPCAKIAHEFVVGDFKDYETVLNFGLNVDIIGIEIEHVNVEALKELKSRGKTVVPEPEVLEMIKDKLLQKEFYLNHQIPTAPVLENKAQPPFVQKMRSGGYDGKGVQVIHTEADLSKQFTTPFVNEQLADIDKELAVIVAKNADGDVIVYDVVEQVFNPEYNLLDYLLTPAQISENQKLKSKQIAKNLVDKFESPGIFTVELFLNKDGTIWVNETAPRVHNSGHATIEATTTSQFDVMLRVLLNLPLAEPKQQQFSAMVNLIGAKDHTGKAQLNGIEKVLGEQNINIHWYGKEETKPGRKIGHCTILGETLNEVQQKVDLVKEHLSVTAKSEI